MVTNPMIGLPCAWCGGPSEGEHSIHRDGFCEGPEVPLCNEHGSMPIPTCEQIWQKIALDRAELGQ
jgi:hypothetical protein